MSVLSDYLAEFSTIGSFPTSLNGYGMGAHRQNQELTALGASPAEDDKAVLGAKPSASSLKLGTERWQQLEPYRIKDLQSHLNALQANAGTSGKLDAKTKSAWSTYARIFREERSELVPAAGGWDSTNWVWMNKIAFAGTGKGTSLKERAQKALAAEKAKPAAAKPAAKAATKPAAKAASKPAGTSAGTQVVSTRDLQNVLLALGANKTGLGDGKFGPSTQAKWAAEAKKRGLADTITGAKGATKATVNALTYTTLLAEAQKAPPPAPEPVGKKDMIANTRDVQQLMINIGAPRKSLDDGLFGPTTTREWMAMAQKRGLDPYIAKHTADGKQVVVRESTYLRIKADADAKVPPTVATGVATPSIGGSLWQLPVADIAIVTIDQLGPVVSRLSGKTSIPDMSATYAQVAKANNVDPRIEADPQGRIGVIKSAWTALQALYDKTAPAPSSLPKSEADAAWAAIKKGSTASLSAQTLRDGLNALVADGRINHAAFSKGVWDQNLRPYVLDALEITKEPERSQWSSALVPGKLVSGDKKTLKLPPNGVAFFKAAAAKLAQAKKDASTVLAGYTKVNTADVIARINALNISSIKFDKNGDARVLGDAIRTFFDNTKTKAPSGDYIRLVGKDVLVKNEILSALAAGVAATDERAEASKKFRANIVSNALRESSADITVDDLQHAIMHTALRKEGGDNQKTYEAVKNTGAFDAPTRAAYTKIARTLTIGPAILQLEKLLKEQLGPNYKVDSVKEVQTQTWGEFLDKAVSKVGSTIRVKTLPALAQQINAAAALYQKNTAADTRQQDKVVAQNAALSDAVKKSTAIVSIFDVQQALLQMASKKQIKVSGLKVTGTADGATRTGLFQVASYIFPEGYAVPETMWLAYLKKVGIRVVSPTSVGEGWSSGTNYIALPPALADTFSKRAGEYMALKGVPVGASSLAPVPLTNQELRLRFNNPAVITAQRPAAKQDLVDFTQGGASQSAATTSGGGSAAGGSASSGSSAGGSATSGSSAGGAGGSGGNTNVVGPNITGPTFNITIPQQTQPTVMAPSPLYTMPTSGEGALVPTNDGAFAPPEAAPAAPTAASDAASASASDAVTQASVLPSSGLGWLWLLGAGAVAAVVFKGDKKNAIAGKTNTRAGAKPRRSSTQKRYSTR